MPSFSELLSTHLIGPQLPVSGGGLRYGSVIYLGFGAMRTEARRDRAIRRFEVELEFGADDWSIILDGKTYLDSHRSDLWLERDDIDAMFVGGRLLDQSWDSKFVDQQLSGGIVIRSVIRSDQASGFLFALDIGGVSYETLDGKATLPWAKGFHRVR